MQSLQKERPLLTGKKPFGYIFTIYMKKLLGLDTVYSTVSKYINTSNHEMKYKNQIKEHNGVRYKSMLELTCATLLTQSNIDFKYEPIDYLLVDSGNYSGIIYEKKVSKGTKIYGPIKGKIRSISYTPDFVGDNWIIETKGYETPEFKLKWKLFQHELLKQGKSPHLFKPTNKKELVQTITIIKELIYNQKQSTSNGNVTKQPDQGSASATKKGTKGNRSRKRRKS
jgi:hypothetical protein